MTAGIERILPLPDDASAEFWAACRRHELRMQRCARCERFRFPPRPMCPSCQSMESLWPLVSGEGKIASFVIVHPPVLPAFRDKTPFPVLLVELDEDPRLRMIGNLIGGRSDALRIGAPVEVAFEDLTPEVSLPQWRIR
jgi:uncharacterized OB-fold protein